MNEAHSRERSDDFCLWVVGQGLIGSALVGSHDLTYVPSKFDWQTPKLQLQLRSAAAGFAEFAGGRNWAVVWAAGRGVVGATAEEMAPENEALGWLLDVLHENRPSGQGALLTVSSAGAIYANSSRPPFTEFTKPEPITAYGEAKRDQEELVLAAAEALSVRAIVIRAANVYGRGQNMSKAQGLISHLCRTAVTRQPTNLYVSGDTMRHYIWNHDLASLINRVLSRSFEQAPPFKLIKLATGAASTTVAELVGVVQRVSKIPVRVGLGAEARTNQQAKDLRLQSKVWVELDDVFEMPLVAGVKEVLDAFRFPQAMAN